MMERISSVDRHGAALTLFVAVVASACSSERATRHDQDLLSVLWIQTSAEYQALCTQTYRAANAALDTALSQPEWTAALEQGDNPGRLPPAIIVDVDETLLDNAPYNARLIQRGESFDIETWNAWVEEQRAHALAGAAEFLQAASQRGVTVFYVTNRGNEVEAATRANLIAKGFPLPPPSDELDLLLMRNEHDTAGSEKSPRRARVAATHKIIMLIGDDLGDFIPGARKASVAERQAHVAKYREFWGKQWFVLPNPIYGSWLSVLGDDRRSALITGS